MKIFIIILVFLFSVSLSAAQFAVVKSHKAIIYSDHTLQSPIGFIPVGTKIRIGDKIKKKRFVITLIKRKIAFVKIKDLILPKAEQREVVRRSNIIENRETGLSRWYNVEQTIIPSKLKWSSELSYILTSEKIIENKHSGDEDSFSFKESSPFTLKLQFNFATSSYYFHEVTGQVTKFNRFTYDTSEEKKVSLPWEFHTAYHFNILDPLFFSIYFNAGIEYESNSTLNIFKSENTTEIRSLKNKTLNYSFGIFIPVKLKYFKLYLKVNYAHSLLGTINTRFNEQLSNKLTSTKISSELKVGINDEYLLYLNYSNHQLTDYVKTDITRIGIGITFKHDW